MVLKKKKSSLKSNVQTWNPTLIEESDYHKHNIYFDIDGLDFYLEFLKKKDFFLLELKVLKEVLQNKCNAPTNVLNYKIKKKKNLDFLFLIDESLIKYY